MRGEQEADEESWLSPLYEGNSRVIRAEGESLDLAIYRLSKRQYEVDHQKLAVLLFFLEVLKFSKRMQEARGSNSHSYYYFKSVRNCKRLLQTVPRERLIAILRLQLRDLVSEVSLEEWLGRETGTRLLSEVQWLHALLPRLREGYSPESLVDQLSQIGK